MRLIIVSIFLFCTAVPTTILYGAANDQQLHNASQLYRKIGRKLTDIKKEAPTCGNKISSVLDDVDRMYNLINSSLHTDETTMKELETRTIESAVLQKELLLAKQESENLKQSLQAAQIQVEKEHAQVVLLKEQHMQLVEKQSLQSDLISAELSKIDKQLTPDIEKNKEGASVIQAKEQDKMVASPKESHGGGQKIAILGQNLNLTSTSDPSSPR
ncbi:hypothetical protein FJ364_04075 [Candidatus Dependentiae bacterium]|nr:hypothetical protein [Candidatus Dependentiae bacterium]